MKNFLIGLGILIFGFLFGGIFGLILMGSDRSVYAPWYEAFSYIGFGMVALGPLVWWIILPLRPLIKGKKIIGNILTGLGIGILGFLLLNIFGSLTDDVAQSKWATLYEIISNIGLGMVVLGPLVWWIILPIRHLTKGKIRNPLKGKKIIGNILTGLIVLILGLVITWVFTSKFHSAGGSKWASWYEIFSDIGFGMVVLGPLVWWIILPIKPLIKGKIKNPLKGKKIIGNILTGLVVLILGFIIIGVFNSKFNSAGGSEWTSLYNLFSILGLVMMVLGPLVWWIILPIRTLIIRRRENAK